MVWSPLTRAGDYTSGERFHLAEFGGPATFRGVYYGHDLAYVHDRGFGGHADECAPGLLRVLRPVLDLSGLVLELGCGSGRLTRHLIRAGHRVIATDASEAMLSLAREAVPTATVERLTLPDHSMPQVDAVVSVGHVLSSLDSEAEIHRSLRSAALALRPGGVLALDICDLAWGEHRFGDEPHARIGDDWAIIVEYETPTADRFIRQIATFMRDTDGSWRRANERHENVLIDASSIPDLLAEHGVDAEVRPAFGAELLPVGLVAVVGTKR